MDEHLFDGFSSVFFSKSLDGQVEELEAAVGQVVVSWLVLDGSYGQLVEEQELRSKDALVLLAQLVDQFACTCKCCAKNQLNFFTSGGADRVDHLVDRLVVCVGMCAT